MYGTVKAEMVCTQVRTFSYEIIIGIMSKYTCR